MIPKFRWRFALWLLVVSCWPDRALSAQISSRFDQGAEGWIMADLPYPSGPFTTAVTNYPTTYSSTNGNPGGHIWLRDPMSSRVYYFQAPGAYLGNRSNFYGGLLRFDIKRENGGILNYPDVVLVGGGFTFVIDAGPGPAANVWSNFSVRLSEAGGWKKNTLSGAAPTAEEYKSVLQDLTSLRIRGEYSTVSTDTGALDKVVMSPPAPLTLSLARRPAEELRLCWNSETGRVYQVQAQTTLLTNGWLNFGTARAGTGSNDCVTLPASGLPREFYRVIGEP